MPVRAGLRILSGSVIVRIDGRVNENLYPWSIFQNPQEDRFNDNPAVIEGGSITKNETRIMFAGEEYEFSVLTTEVVMINFRSLDGNDVELLVQRHGREEIYTVEGTNRLGLSLGFQNR